MMAKTMRSFRLDDESMATLERLQSLHGYETATDALHDALQGWEAALGAAAVAVAGRFTPAEWCLMAGVMNGTLWPGGTPRSGAYLAAEVADGHTLDGMGYRWLVPDGADVPAALLTPDQRAAVDAYAADLCFRLATLSPVEAAAVARAVCWFWSRPDVGLGVPWWDPAWRLDHPAPAAEDAG